MATMLIIGEVANFAQLAGIDAVKLIQMIVQAAKRARMHKRNCRQFAENLKLIGNILEHLRISELKRYPGTREPLEQLEGTLRTSFMLVDSCQDRNYLYRLAYGRSIVNQFREAQSEIDRYLKLIPLIQLVDNTRIKEWLEYIARNQCQYTLDDEDIMQVQNYHDSLGYNANFHGYDDQGALLFHPPPSSDPYFNPIPSTTAPPVPSSYPPYPFNPHDHIPNPNQNTTPLPQQQVPPPLPYSFPHLDPSSFHYHPNQAAAVNYDQSNYYSYRSSGASHSVQNYDISLGYNANFHGYGDHGGNY